MRNLIHDLTMNAAEQGEALPEMQFFKPKEQFFSYLDKRFPQMPIVDIGAGTGHLSMALAERGWKVIAIDPFERDGRVWNVVPLDAITFNYPPESLPIVARPCHGHWLEMSIEQAMRTCSVMLYVGLQKNFEQDLDGLDRLYFLSYRREIVGSDGEVVVVIKNRH